MTISNILNTNNWIYNFCYNNPFIKDLRLKNRLYNSMLQISNNPSKSHPEQFETWAELNGFYRLINNEKISFNFLMDPYFNTVKEKVDKLNKVLIIHDTSTLTYSSHTKIKGINPIHPNNADDKGLLLHTSLAIDADNKNIIGIINQKPFNRVPKNKTLKRGKQHILSKKPESDVWSELVNNIGRSNTDTQYIHIGDRGSDMHVFFNTCLSNNSDFLIRAKHNRKLTNHTRENPMNFIDKLKKLPILDTQIVEIPVKGTSKKRKVTLNISYSKYHIKTPQHRSINNMEVYGIRVWEDTIDGSLEWFLTTSIPIKDIKEAWVLVDYYKSRWIIEEYHKCLKTGCNIENRNFSNKNKIENVLGILSPIACKLLCIKHISKANPNKLAKEYIDKSLLLVLTKYKKLSFDTITIKEFYHNVANLGGFLMRKHDGNPGWITLWRGWNTLLIMLKGVKLFNNDINGDTLEDIRMKDNNENIKQNIKDIFMEMRCV